RVESLVYRRDEQPIAKVQGVSRASSSRVSAAQFTPDASGLFSLAIASGQFDGDAAAPGAGLTRVSYLALGGQPGRRTPASGPLVAHWPGTPQGRSSGEPGPHSCTLVEVDH